jgi:predicted outer membrane repeat protein
VPPTSDAAIHAYQANPLNPLHNPLPTARRLAACALPLALGATLAVALLLALGGGFARPARAAPAARPREDQVIVTTTIQAAIDSASPGDTVFVPAGLYTESLTLTKAVSLTGPSPYSATIHALPNQRVLAITGAAVDSSVVISGLTFAGGYQPDSFPNGHGGGLNLQAGAAPRLVNLIIRDNTATHLGGGLYSESPASLENVRFISNTASTGGGGVYLWGASGGTVISGSLFQGNRCLSGYAPCSGGGMFAAMPVTLVNVSFISNTAEGNGGGGAYLIDPTGSVITGGLFQGNQHVVGGQFVVPGTGGASSPRAGSR